MPGLLLCGLLLLPPLAQAVLFDRHNVDEQPTPLSTLSLSGFASSTGASGLGYENSTFLQNDRWRFYLEGVLMRYLLSLLVLLLSACQAPPSQSLHLPPLQQSVVSAQQAWPAVPPLSPPYVLRPCCAFGYNLRTQLLSIPVPFYQLDNVVDADNTGVHHYNNQPLYALLSLVGINGEHNAQIYTRRGGFIDLAHLRETADNTLWLFSQIWQAEGHPRRIALHDELGERIIELLAFVPPASATERYNLATRLAARACPRQRSLTATATFPRWHRLLSRPTGGSWHSLEKPVAERCDTGNHKNTLYFFVTYPAAAASPWLRSCPPVAVISPGNRLPGQHMT